MTAYSEKRLETTHLCQTGDEHHFSSFQALASLLKAQPDRLNIQPALILAYRAERHIDWVYHAAIGKMVKLNVLIP